MRPVRCGPSKLLSPALVGVLTALLLALVACGSGGSSTATSPLPSAAAYSGLWRSTSLPSGDVRWIRATGDGKTVMLSWEQKWEPAVTQAATVQGDGSIKAPAVDATFDSGLFADSVPAYTGRLTADGGLEMSTTTRVTGVDADIPVTLSFVRGSEAGYAAFAAERDKNVAEQRASEAFNALLQTIFQGVQAWMYTHDGVPPPAAEVRPGGEVGKLLLDEGTDWPRLESGELLLPGEGSGTYRYRRLPVKHGFQIRGTAPGGEQQTLSRTG